MVLPSSLCMVGGKTQTSWIFLFGSKDTDFLRSDSFLVFPPPFFFHKDNYSLSLWQTIYVTLLEQNVSTEKRVFCRQIYRAFKQVELTVLDRVIKYSRLTQLASSEKVLYRWVERGSAVWKPAMIRKNWKRKKKKEGGKQAAHNPNKHLSRNSKHNLHSTTV